MDMSANAAATRRDIDDVLNVLDVMMTRIDDRFTKIESDILRLQKDMQNVLIRLDHIEKKVEISDDERLVMAHQLTQLHDWVEKAAARIDVKFVH